MLASLRTFRFMAALMAVLLLGSGVLPLVQHACAMTKRHEPAQDHASCPHHQPEGTSTHSGMHGHAAMHASSQAETPCAYDAPSRTEPSTCCLIQAAPGVTTNGVRLSKRSLEPVVVLFATLLADAGSSSGNGLSHQVFLDVGPPPASAVPLHLVHSVLLH